MDEKEEYDKYQNPEEYERRMNLIRKGIDNAKKNSAQKKAFLETKNRWMKRRDVTEKFDI